MTLIIHMFYRFHLSFLLYVRMMADDRLFRIGFNSSFWDNWVFKIEAINFFFNNYVQCFTGECSVDGQSWLWVQNMESPEKQPGCFAMMGGSSVSDRSWVLSVAAAWTEGVPSFPFQRLALRVHRALDVLWVALWPAPISDYLAEPKAMAQGAHGCFHPFCSTLDRGAGESI